MSAKLFALLIIVALGSIVSRASAKAELGKFHETTRFKLGGEGGWDYLTVDPDAQRLYVARSNRIMVIDVDSGKLLGEVPNLDGAHGIDIVKELGVGFATSGKSGEVISFGLNDFKIVKRTKSGENPDALVYDSPSKKILVFNGKTKDMTAIDAGTMKVVGTLALLGKPEFAVSDGAGHVFVNLEDQNELLAIDPVLLKITGRYPLKPCEEPTGISMDRMSKRLVVGCGNSLAAIVDSNTGHVLQTFKVGQGVDATAFDPKQKLAFISAREGRLTVLSEDSSGGFHVLQDLTTLKGARTVAVDTKSGKVFLPTSQFKPATATEQTQAHFRPTAIPGTFLVLVVARE